MHLIVMYDLWQFLSLIFYNLIFYDLPVLSSNGQVICRMSLSLSMCDVISYG